MFSIRWLVFSGIVLWKWEASSKNNALTYRVRRCSSSGKGIIFLFHDCGVCDCFYGWWEIKNDTLAGSFGFVGASILIVALTKAMQTLPI